MRSVAACRHGTSCPRATLLTRNANRRRPTNQGVRHRRRREARRLRHVHRRAARGAGGGQRGRDGARQQLRAGVQRRPANQAPPAAEDDSWSMIRSGGRSELIRLHITYMTSFTRSRRQWRQSPLTTGRPAGAAVDASSCLQAATLKRSRDCGRGTCAPARTAHRTGPFLPSPKTIPSSRDTYSRFCRPSLCISIYLSLSLHLIILVCLNPAPKPLPNPFLSLSTAHS
jgi:hypothetical protein